MSAFPASPALGSRVRVIGVWCSDRGRHGLVVPCPSHSFLAEGSRVGVVRDREPLSATWVRLEGERLPMLFRNDEIETVPFTLAEMEP